MPRRTLITGGSGALGTALVRRFVSEDCAVVFTYNTAAESAAALQRETGAFVVQADLTRADQVHEAVARLLDYLGGFDILINAAGSTQVMPFALIEERDWDDIMDSNLKSMFLVTKEIVRSMIAQRAGAIVNVGSIAGQRLLDVPVHYATAKAGVSGFTIGLAGELRRYGIRVNSVIPGLLEGGISQHVPEKELRDYLAHCAAARPGRMDEVADLVFFLASDRASYINAQNIQIDGGL